MSFKRRTRRIAVILLSLCIMASQFIIPAQPVYAAGGSWEDVGGATISDAEVSYSYSLQFSNGVPYITFRDNTDTVRILKYDGTEWQEIWSYGGTSQISMYVYNGIPYVACITGGTLKVMKIEDGTATELEGAGSLSNSYRITAIYVYNGDPYVAYSSGNYGYVSLIKYTGGQWSSVGDQDFSSMCGNSSGHADSLNLIVDNDISYVSFVGYSGAPIFVMKHDSAGWEIAGGGATGSGISNSLFLDGDTLYIAFPDLQSGEHVSVMRFNDISNTWEAIGSRGFSQGLSGQTSLFVDSGVPYVAFDDSSFSHKASVMKYDGEEWVAVGDQGFSYGDAGFIHLIVENGTPYVAYRDGRPAMDWGMPGMGQPATGLGAKGVVKKFAPPPEAPTAPPTDLNFSVSADGHTKLSFTPSQSAEKYLIVRKSGSAPTFVPADGTEYASGAQDGEEIVYAGASATFIDEGTASGTDYYYKIFAYNGEDEDAVYLTGDTLDGSISIKAGSSGSMAVLNGSEPTAAGFPDAGVTVTFPSGAHTTLTVTKATNAPASNFYGSIPGGRAPKAMYFTISSSNSSPGTYTIVLDFSGLGLTQAQWENFILMKRPNASGPWTSIEDLGGTIVSRNTDGVWGKFTISGLSSFSQFAGCEGAEEYTVTSAADDNGNGTLRKVIETAQAGDIVNFDSTAMGSDTIELSAPLEIDKDIKIAGPDNGIKLDGDGRFRVVTIGADAIVTLENLKLQNGEDADNMAGGIYNAGTLTLLNCVVSNNSETGSTTVDEETYGGVGGILQDTPEAVLYIINSTIADNTGASDNYGTGGILAAGGTVEIYNSIIYGNRGQYVDAYLDGAIETTSHNSLYGDAAASVRIDSGSGNIFDTDPRFVGVGSSPYLIYGVSPCVDAGNNAYAISDNDIRGSGFGRKLDKDDASSGTADMGAYEYKYGVDIRNYIPAITEAGITGLAAPAAGAEPITAGSLTAGAGTYSVTKLTWENSDGTDATLTAGGKFKAGTAYKAEIELTAATGNKFRALTPEVDAGTPGEGTISGDTEGNKLTFTVTFDPTAAKAAADIAVKTQPAKLTYTAGETLDLTGLTVTLTYNDGTTEDVVLGDFAGKGITTDPADGTTLVRVTHNGSPVTLTCNTHTAITGDLTINDPGPAPISAASVTLTTPAAGASPQTEAEAETATGNADYTVTGLTWNEALTASGKFMAGQVYTATVTLTSKNGREFQTAAFTPSVAGSASAGATSTAGTGTGNTASFTVTFNATAARSVTGIAVKTQPDRLIYTTGEALELSGLVAVLTYNDGTTEDVAFAQFAEANITASPENGTVLSAAAHNGNPVTLICNGRQTATDNLTINASIPSAPDIRSAVAGDAHALISWGSVPGAMGYTIYMSAIPGSYDGSVQATVGEDVNSYDAAGLTNGTTYYFVVKAIIDGNEGPGSVEVSAVPRTVPGAPVNVSAEAGDGQATVTFTAPADNGGSPITGYVAVSNPGNITTTGSGLSITITGLTNGTSYTFTVKAVNAAGNGPESAASNAVTPFTPSNGGNTGGGGTPPAVQPEKPGVEILVNGKTETAATAVITKVEDKTVITVTIDDKKIDEKLQKEGNNTVVTIPVKNDADVVIGQINGQTVKNMELKEAVLEIKTGNVTYTLPAARINIDAVSSEIGRQVDLKDIAVNVKISSPSDETVKIVQNTADRNSYSIVVKPVEFEITCTSGSKTIEVSKFNGYVERTVAIPEGVDPAKISTGIVLNADGTFSHVPTTIIVIDGKYYARINSLTNSAYSVIWSPKAFKDVENHWAKAAVNDMGSRLIISGVGKDKFEPDRDVTRAEFAAIAVRALGLMRTGTGRDVFDDVTKDSPYYDAVSVANEYGIASGYKNGEFEPAARLTREQAMVMIAEAMEVTGLKTELKGGEAEKLLEAFKDSGEVSEWAKAAVASCLKEEILSGRGGSLIAPKENITRAEVAVIIQKLLQKSNLI